MALVLTADVRRPTFRRGSLSLSVQSPSDTQSHSGEIEAEVVSGEAERRGEVHAVAVESVSKRFGSFVAVQPTSFTVPSGSLVTLLGPSGSGKTTLLKIIAGFEEPSTGQVMIAGADVTRVPPHKRNLGFVFQQYALFPHLTVAENVAYPLKMRRTPAAEIRRQVADALKMVQLQDLGDRYPSQLSGGQQQRVALARAVVFRPPLLLMDEPMSALDKRLREEMQYEIRRLQKQLGITTIAVTHDQTEALVMSDAILVLNAGRIEQSGPPEEVYRRPRSEFVANFLGESNIFRGTVREEHGRPYLDCSGATRIPLRGTQIPGTGSTVAYIVRPEAISIGSDLHENAIRLSGRIIEATFSGESVRVQIDVGLANPVIGKLLTRHEAPAPRLGEEITFGWRAEDATIINV